MTREQLDAIRARVEAAKTADGWEPVHTIHKASYVDDTYTGFQACCPIVFCGEYGDRSSDDANELSYAHMDLIGNAPADLTALLAEVERLTVEREESEHQMHLRVRAGYDKTVADSWRAWAEKQSEAAFSRGVAAMREAAIEWAWRNFVLGAMASVVVRDLRALPAPEDKS